MLEPDSVPTPSWDRIVPIEKAQRLRVFLGHIMQIRFKSVFVFFIRLKVKSREIEDVAAF